MKILSKQKGEIGIFAAILISLVLIALVVGIVAGGFYLFTKTSSSTPDLNTSVNDTSASDTVGGVISTSAITNSDLEAAKLVFNNFINAAQQTTNLRNAIAPYISINSSAFLDELSANKAIYSPAQSSVVEAVPNGENILIRVLTTYEKKEDFYIAIKEDNSWKIDLPLTSKYMISIREKNRAELAALPDFDLAITDVKFSVEHPIVNDKNLIIFVTIKNNGQRALIGGLSGKVQLLGLSGVKSSTLSLSSLGLEIMPGEQKVINYKPYSREGFGSLDVEGKKILQVSFGEAGNHVNDEIPQNVEIFTKELEVFAQ